MANLLTRKQKFLIGAIAGLAVLNFFVFREVFAIAAARRLTVSVLNVGQGDSILVQTPSLRNILIDGGPNALVTGKIRARLPFWERRLDAVILTHPDADHLQGLLRVLKHYRADYIIWTGVVRDGQAYEQWLEILKDQQKKGARVAIARSGLVLSSGKAAMRVLHPFNDVRGHFAAATNDTGAVIRLSYGRHSFLLTGDISSQVEQRLVAQDAPLESDVLKIAHHGSKHSSSAAFLQAVRPGVAAISVGKNSYGHPAPDVLQRLQEFGIKAVRTDLHGDIVFVTDGNNITIK